jgi:DNA-binding transcriptional regulator YhcF (GntR family)
MGKSLTEVAKGILMNESNDPAPDRDAKSMNPNMATLRPGSRSMEPNPMTNDAQDLGPALVRNTDIPPSAKAAGGSKKDTSASSQSRKGTVPAQPPEKMMAEEEDIELSEELEAFIDQCLEEGLSEEEIAQAIDENFEYLGEALDDSDKRTKYGMKAVVSYLTGGKETRRKRMRGNRLYKKKVDDAGKKLVAKANKLSEENLEEDIELSEELEAFIDQCLEEGLSEEEIAQAIDENFEFVTEEENLEEDVDYEYSVDMSEHVAALFEGEDLSEDFKQKAIAIFEAAVTSTVKSEIAAIEEAYAATLEEEVNTLKEELSTNVDDYLNYVVENWVSENEVAIEAGLRTELTEEFISGLRNLFAENYIDIPEDKISVVEELGDKVAELENKLNEEIERNVELSAILSESKKTEVMYSMTEGLTTTQAEKLKSLAENVEFTSEDEYAHKVATLRESYFPSSITSQRALDNYETDNDGKAMITEELQGPMARYVKVLGNKLPN